jgi:hypothetical protein
LYETDNDGKLPDVPRDLESTGILKPGMLAKVWPHVTWLGAPGTKRDALPPDAVLLRYERERKGGPKIVVVGRVDGTVEQVEPKRKAKAKP